MEQQQPPPPAQPLCWEQFLHKKTIRVLLVETDNSTRQVVTALLRHCMYQVIPAENGQQAWEFLQDMQTSIDLVLTEIGPGLSGISLLDKIMAHNVSKNIPVIMMSSNDSTDMVFRCLSTGAADFLVKPIRKNELNNLWQHVWRRCHNSRGSGSGSRSDIQTHKCTKSKSGDDKIDSNGRNGDTSIGLNARDGSDNSSGTQAARAIDSPNCSSKVLEGKETDVDGIMPSLELSLKRPISTGGDANTNYEEQRNVFRRSDLSAFRRYNTYVVSSQGGAGLAGSCSLYGNNSDAAKTDCTDNNMKSSSDVGLMKQGSNGSSSNNDMGSTMKNVVPKPGGNNVSPINRKIHSSTFHRVQQWTPVAAGKDKPGEVGKKNAAGGKGKAGEAERKHPSLVHVESGGSVRVPQFNVTGPSAPVEGHASNYGSSNSGSNNNTNNGITAATAASGAVNVETGGVDQRSIMCLKRERRVTAVKKFREKRKERNFGKKVRYQSRKRLAEQRPRVRGQFVRLLPLATKASVER